MMEEKNHLIPFMKVLSLPAKETHDAHFSMWTMLGSHQLLVKLKNQCTLYHTNFSRLAFSSVCSLYLACNKTTLYAVSRVTNFYVFSIYGSEYTNLKYKISLAKYVFKIFPMIYWQSGWSESIKNNIADFIYPAPYTHAALCLILKDNTDGNKMQTQEAHIKHTNAVTVKSNAQTGSTYSGILSKPEPGCWLTVSLFAKPAPQKNSGVMRSRKENLRRKKKSTLMICYTNNWNSAARKCVRNTTANHSPLLISHTSKWQLNTGKRAY